MTVQELIDSLNNYIKKDPPDTWQLNDCTLDELYYKERCEKRANHEVKLVDTSSLNNDTVKIDYVGSYSDQNGNDICAILFDGKLLRICR